MNRGHLHPEFFLTRSAWRGARGSIVLTFGLVLVCLGLGVCLAAMEVGKFRDRARRERFATELTQLAAIFEKHRKAKGSWPDSTSPESRVPRGMEAALAGTPWMAGPPIGGRYEWICIRKPAPPPPAPAPATPPVEATTPPSSTEAPPDGTSPAPPVAPAPEAKPAPKPAREPVAMIAVTAFAPDSPLRLTAQQLLEIDRRIDDGNLATGRFRTGFNGWPVYRLQPDP